MRIGYHLANDGNITEEHLALLRKAKVSLVKTLLRLDLPVEQEPTDYARLGRELPPETEVVIRLYMPGSTFRPAEFIDRTMLRLIPAQEKLQRKTWIEIHNEPNHRDGIEGWGKTEEDALSFATWYYDVLCGLRDRSVENLGWPGLAVSEWAHGERTWATINLPNMIISDWVGVHCYWQTGVDWEQLDDRRLAKNWMWYRHELDRRGLARKPVIVTEAGNSNCQGPRGPLSPQEQAAQYKIWCEDAYPGVYGVNFFLLGGSADWAGFQVYPETIRSLAQ